MLITDNSKGGVYQLVYNDEAEALFKKGLNVAVIKSQNEFFVESPGDSMIRSFEKLIYQDGKRIKN